ncbi:GNAT family N-acetyltransferase [Chitinophaga sp. 22536]|uniref:GNAT family N-acetyltransferase n=1 Tax=unclassified Chitinophaga TaxID=2619133 RepID=UPI003F834557
MITLQQVDIPGQAIKELYEEAFPYEERRDWPVVLSLLGSGKLKILQLEKDGEFAGFVCYWPLPDYTFVEYLAIHAAARGGGIGTHIMEELEKRFGNLVLEVEPPLTEQAKRRVVFYERLGYLAFEQPYYQPPYHEGYPLLELRLMQKGSTHDGETFLNIKNQIYRFVYNLS